MATTDENLCLVLHGANDMRLENRPIPVPGDHDVLLKIGSVGICGSDIVFLAEGRMGPFVVEKPRRVGHEASGTVVKCGSKVNHLKPGDRVALEPLVSCGQCHFCKTGRYNLCPDLKMFSAPPHDGVIGNYHVHAAASCFKLPDDVTLGEAALLEPLSAGVHAAQKANVGIGFRILICGAGPVGLSCMKAARAMGASQIIVTDINEGRLAFASKNGADGTIAVGKGETEEQLLQRINQEFGGKWPNAAFECSGAESATRICVLATESGGSVVLIGIGAPEMKVPIVNAATREVDIKGIFGYANCYPRALAMVASGAVDVKPLICHRFGLKDSLKAFETAKTDTSAIKVIIDCHL